MKSDNIILNHDVILEFHNTPRGTLGVNELFLNAKNDGGHTDNGLSRDYFEKILIENNLQVNRREKIVYVDGLMEIRKSIESGNPVSLSVKRIFCEQDYYHMVVVGFKNDDKGNLLGFYYHEPFSTSVENGKNKYLNIKSSRDDLCNFENYWRKMAVFVSKK